MFYILEIQEMADGQKAHLMKTAETKNEALSEYYNILHYAAISTNPIHTAVVMTSDGKYVARESFTHEVSNEVEE